MFVIRLILGFRLYEYKTQTCYFVRSIACNSCDWSALNEMKEETKLLSCLEPLTRFESHE